MAQKPNKMHDKMSRRIFLEATKSDDFLKTEQVIKRLDDAGFWDETTNEEAIYAFKKSFVRREMRRIIDSRGRPVFANVEITDGEGETTNGYMQQSLFDVSQYKQVINYHNARARHHIAEAHEYAKDLKARHSVQIELPFPMIEEIRKAA